MQKSLLEEIEEIQTHIFFLFQIYEMLQSYLYNYYMSKKESENILEELYG